jgi:hypothetical protein
MVTLVINAPREKVQAEAKKSFQNTFDTGIGEGYAIAMKLFEQCRPGCTVVLLSKDERKRAEGKLVKLVPTVKTGSGMQRYDVYIDNMRMVPYKSEALNRNGVAVIRS